MLKEDLERFLQKKLKLPSLSLEVPPDPSWGDYALPTFPLAKVLKKPPIEIAKGLSQTLGDPSSRPSYVMKMEAKGPYLNFFLAPLLVAEWLLNRILKEKQAFGSSHQGKGKKVVVEHTSINPNAAPHVGRSRNALLGDAIVRLLRFQGYKVETHYFVNDAGKQIALLVLACHKKKPTFDDLLKIYVEINQRLKNRPELEQEAFQLLNRLEKGDKTVIRQFRRVVKICIQGQTALFSKLGIHFDYFDYDSDYLKGNKLQKLLAQLKQRANLFTDEAGRQVLNQEELSQAMRHPFFVLTRKDGTSLYGLRDIAYTLDKLKRGAFNVLVLGEDQKLYFQQISLALKALGYEAPRVIHYSFVLLPGGEKMSTRRGEVVLLSEFMQKSLEKAKQEIEARKHAYTLRLGEAIAYGAVKYSILKVSPEKNVLFDWSQALSFEGDSGPYLQYTHARASAILRKAKIKNFPSKVSKKGVHILHHEYALIKCLASFPEIISKATTGFQPHLLANYLFELAQAFNVMYQNEARILSETGQMRLFRLAVVQATKQVLSTGLGLLGIEAPERM